MQAYLLNGTLTSLSGHSVTVTATIIHIAIPWLLPGEEDTSGLPSATSGGTTAGKERKGLREEAARKNN